MTETPGAPRKTYPLNTQLTAQAQADLTYLQEAFGGISKRDVIQAALAAGRWYFEGRAAGKELFTRDSDGVEEVQYLGNYQPPPPPSN